MNPSQKEKNMNKRQIVASLNKIANELDNTGLFTEANTVTKVMSRLAFDDFDERDLLNDNMEDNTEDMGYCPDCGEWIGDNQHCEDCGWGMDDEDDDQGFGVEDKYLTSGDDFELGLKAVPHTRIKNPSNYDEKMHNHDDYDISLDDDY